MGVALITFPTKTPLVGVAYLSVGYSCDPETL